MGFQRWRHLDRVSGIDRLGMRHWYDGDDAAALRDVLGSDDGTRAGFVTVLCTLTMLPCPKVHISDD